jgi:hypothetical protein
MFGGLGGCQSPCDSLAETICECELNSAEESACLEAVRANRRPVTIPEEETCSVHVETCTCEALEDGNLVACGLAKAGTGEGG